MLYFINNILCNVSKYNNIYNIIYFSGEVKRNCIMVNYLKTSLLLRDFSTSLEMIKKIEIKRANTQCTHTGSPLHLVKRKIN